jgi:hypothetical protein
MTELIALALVLLPFLAVTALLIEAVWGRGADDTAWMDLIRA